MPNEAKCADTDKATFYVEMKILMKRKKLILLFLNKNINFLAFLIKFTKRELKLNKNSAFKHHLASLKYFKLMKKKKMTSNCVRILCIFCG